MSFRSFSSWVLEDIGLSRSRETATTTWIKLCPPKPQLENDLKDAMRAGDELRKRTLRMALSAINLAEVEKGTPLDEPAVLAILQKEIKTQREAIADAERAGRPDLTAEAAAQIRQLASYLPQ